MSSCAQSDTPGTTGLPGRTNLFLENLFWGFTILAADQTPQERTEERAASPPLDGELMNPINESK